MKRRLQLWWWRRQGRLAYMPLTPFQGHERAPIVPYYPGTVPVLAQHAVLATPTLEPPEPLGLAKLVDNARSPYNGDPCAVYLLPVGSESGSPSGGWLGGELREIVMVPTLGFPVRRRST